MAALSSAPSSNRNTWNTIRPEPKQTRSYWVSLTLAFVFTTIMTAAILIFVLAYVWEGQFSTYTRQNMQRLADNTAQSISAHFQMSGSWTPDVLRAAYRASQMSKDIGVEVVDAQGEVLFTDPIAKGNSDGSQHGSSFDSAEDLLAEEDELDSPNKKDTGPFISSVTPGTKSLAPKEPAAFVKASIVNKERQVIGTVRIWAFGSDALLTPSDVDFRTRSYVAIAIAAAVATILASVVGFAASRSLSQPLVKITRAARQIRNGNLTARSGISGSDEIGQLGETFDDMAGTLERDLKLEHRLTGDVAHELRTPLMAMLATVEAMQDGVLPADDEHFETVASEVRRLSRLVDAMLKLSRLESSDKNCELVRTDIVFLAKNLVATQRQLFHEKGLHLRFVNESSRNEIYADVDADLLREAMVNLMSNALRYTNPDGWVKVSCKTERQDVVIAVQDTGIGIAREDIPQTFSRFWRSDASRERESGGLGVGLAITKEIVDKHNGTISVESELGRGTTFTIRIPMVNRNSAKQNSKV